ncbi:hypothetical protein BC938DRAFT_474357 [Jimgerdemannia flammicorona]|uniref:DNA endonuclease activator Ctp1 C-terminal domain-containing protein n=1 Tax=Jimgerdemannia flammicorona TaxID=994334 RepID=A0A433Q2G5_9FUNG|nr:hypothetical protein BC938DRAFT_474357 [Jimgerdemannia flammicorona]
MSFRDHLRALDDAHERETAQLRDRLAALEDQNDLLRQKLEASEQDAALREANLCAHLKSLENELKPFRDCMRLPIGHKLSVLEQAEAVLRSNTADSQLNAHADNAPTSPAGCRFCEQQRIANSLALEQNTLDWQDRYDKKSSLYVKLRCDYDKVLKQYRTLKGRYDAKKARAAEKTKGRSEREERNHGQSEKMNAPSTPVRKERNGKMRFVEGHGDDGEIGREHRADVAKVPERLLIKSPGDRDRAQHAGVVDPVAIGFSSPLQRPSISTHRAGPSKQAPAPTSPLPTALRQQYLLSTNSNAAHAHESSEKRARMKLAKNGSRVLYASILKSETGSTVAGEQAYGADKDRERAILLVEPGRVVAGSGDSTDVQDKRKWSDRQEEHGSAGGVKLEEQTCLVLQTLPSLSIACDNDNDNDDDGNLTPNKRGETGAGRMMSFPTAIATPVVVRAPWSSPSISVIPSSLEFERRVLPPSMGEALDSSPTDSALSIDPRGRRKHSEREICDSEDVRESVLEVGRPGCEGGNGGDSGGKRKEVAAAREQVSSPVREKRLDKGETRWMEGDDDHTVMATGTNTATFVRHSDQNVPASKKRRAPEQDGEDEGQTGTPKTDTLKAWKRRKREALAAEVKDGGRSGKMGSGRSPIDVAIPSTMQSPSKTRFAITDTSPSSSIWLATNQKNVSYLENNPLTPSRSSTKLMSTPKLDKATVIAETVSGSLTYPAFPSTALVPRHRAAVPVTVNANDLLGADNVREDVVNTIFDREGDESYPLFRIKPRVTTTSHSGLEAQQVVFGVGEKGKQQEASMHGGDEWLTDGDLDDGPDLLGMKSAATSRSRTEIKKNDRTVSAETGVRNQHQDISMTSIQHQPLDPKRNGGVNYKYTEVVRKKDERRKMHGSDCSCCRNFYKVTGPLPTVDTHGPRFRSPVPNDDNDDAPADENRRLQERRDLVSKHRYLYKPPNTPPGFWEVDFPNTQQVEEWNETAREGTTCRVSQHLDNH